MCMVTRRLLPDRAADSDPRYPWTLSAGLLGFHRFGACGSPTPDAIRTRCFPAGGRLRAPGRVTTISALSVTESYRNWSASTGRHRTTWLSVPCNRACAVGIPPARAAPPAGTQTDPVRRRRAELCRQGLGCGGCPLGPDVSGRV